MLSPSPAFRFRSLRSMATRHFALAVVVSLGLIGSVPGFAQAPSMQRTAGVTDSGPDWSELTQRQRGALQPLQNSWNSIAPDHKEKWIDLAARLPRMSPDEQARVQARMTEWAQMTPQERGKARLRFQEAKRLAPDDRQARWQSYQALSEEQRLELSERAKQSSAPVARSSASRAAAAALGNAGAKSLSERRPGSSPGAEAPQKSNRPADPSRTVRAEAIAPAIVQAKPGATTTLISKRTATQPQQSGVPKIAAAPDAVNASTLLPQKGPQSALRQPRGPLTPPAAVQPDNPDMYKAP